MVRTRVYRRAQHQHLPVAPQEEPPQEDPPQEDPPQEEPPVVLYQLSAATHLQPRLNSLVATLGTEDVVEIVDFTVLSLEQDGGVPRVECILSRTTGLLHIIIDANVHIKIPVRWNY